MTLITPGAGGRRVRALIGLWLVVFLTAGPTLDAMLRTVSHTAPADYNTITGALAASASGDEIQVAAGRYDAAAGETFPLALKNGVRLIGADRDTTTISAPSGVNAFLNDDTPLNAQTMFSAFTVQHDAAGSDDTLMEFVLTGATMSPDIRANRFIGNADEVDSGVVIAGSTTGSGIFNGMISGNELTGFTSTLPLFNGKGGGVELIMMDFSSLESSRDTPEIQGAVVEAEISPTIRGNTFSGNGLGVVVVSFPGDYSYSPTSSGVMAPLIDDNDFERNTTDLLLLSSGIGARVFDPSFTNNRSTEPDASVVSSKFYGTMSLPAAAGSKGATWPRPNVTVESPRWRRQDGGLKAHDSPSSLRKVAAMSRNGFPRVQAAANTVYSPTISGNTVNDPRFAGVDLYSYLASWGDVRVDLDVTDNVVVSSGGWGIWAGVRILAGQHAEGDTISVGQNRVTRSVGTGLSVFVEGSFVFGAPTAHDIQVVGNRVEGSEIGLLVSSQDYTTLAPLVSCNVLTNNETGVLVKDGADPTPDFGGGARSSPGNNSIFGNDRYEMANYSDKLVKAENNFWGTTTSATIEAKTYDTTEAPTVGEIDFDPPRAAPAAGCGLVAASADLTITKSVSSPGPFAIGDGFTYVITIRNEGPDPATNMVIRDPLPAQVAFLNASAGCTHAAGVVTCSVPSLAVGASTQRVIDVSAIAAGNPVNTATVAGAEADPTAANSASSAVTISGPAVPTTSDLGLLVLCLVMALAGVCWLRRGV